MWRVHRQIALFFILAFPDNAFHLSIAQGNELDQFEVDSQGRLKVYKFTKRSLRHWSQLLQASRICSRWPLRWIVNASLYIGFWFGWATVLPHIRVRNHSAILGNYFCQYLTLIVLSRGRKFRISRVPGTRFSVRIFRPGQPGLPSLRGRWIGDREAPLTVNDLTTSMN